MALDQVNALLTSARLVLNREKHAIKQFSLRQCMHCGEFWRDSKHDQWGLMVYCPSATCHAQQCCKCENKCDAEKPCVDEYADGSPGRQPGPPTALQQEQEQASRDLIDRITKPCPSCNSPILKEDGCFRTICMI